MSKSDGPFKLGEENLEERIKGYLKDQAFIYPEGLVRANIFSRLITLTILYYFLGWTTDDETTIPKLSHRQCHHILA